MSNNSYKLGTIIDDDRLAIGVRKLTVPLPGGPLKPIPPFFDWGKQTPRFHQINEILKEYYNSSLQLVSRKANEVKGKVGAQTFIVVAPDVLVWEKHTGKQLRSTNGYNKIHIRGHSIKASEFVKLPKETHIRLNNNEKYPFDTVDLRRKNLRDVPEDLPDSLFSLKLDNTKITNLHNIHKKVPRCHEISLVDCPIESHILGLLLIKDLTFVRFFKLYRPVDPKLVELDKIIAKHLRKQDIVKCQDELIEAGLAQFGKL